MQFVMGLLFNIGFGIVLGGFSAIVPNAFVEQGLLIISSLISLAFTYALIIRRLHDINYDGWVSMMTLVPILNIGFTLWLLVKENDGDNRYGPATTSENNLQKIFGGIKTYGEQPY